MTARISFRKLQKENLLHRPAAILITIFFFVLHVLYYMMRLQNVLINTDFTHGDRVEQILNMTAPQVGMIFLVICLAGFLGINGFCYLHSKTKTDFYHSLPVKRNTLFYIIFINTFLLFLISMAVALVVETAVTCAAGFFSGALLRNVVEALLCYTLTFLGTYFTAAFAMILTGYLVVGVLGFCVLLSYAPLILRGVGQSYASTFYHTFVAQDNGELLNYFSPGTLAWKMICVEKDSVSHLNGGAVALILVFIVAAAALSLALFKIRRSEAAGKAMAFVKTQPVIRILLVIPMALYAGILLYMTSLESSKIWMLVGVIAGAWMFHGIIESIYQFDLHGLVAAKKQMFISMAAALVIMLFFWFDMSGYDRYIPDEAKVQSVRVSAVQNGVWINHDDDSGNGKGITGEELGDVLSMLKKMSEENIVDVNDETDTVTATYYLKNGKKKIRKYAFYPEKMKKDVDMLYAIPEYKESNWTLFQAKQEDISNLTVYCPVDVNGGGSLELAREEKDEFLEVYREDFKKMTYSETKSQIPMAEFTVCYRMTEENHIRVSEETCYIYPSFEKTIAFLKEKGYPVDKAIRQIKITRMVVTRYGEEGKEQTSVITDKETIDAVKDALIPLDYVSQTLLPGYDENLFIQVYYQSTLGERVLDARIDEKTAGLLK